jgi:hypothetical protein
MKKWTIEEAKKWLKDHDFKTGEMDEIANYYAFRQNDPGKYKSFAAEKKPFNFSENDGVIVIYGIRTENGDKKSEIQSIKFYHGKGKEKEVKGSEDYYSVIINDRNPSGQFLFDSDRNIRLEFAGDGDKFIPTSLNFPQDMTINDALDYIENREASLNGNINIKNYPINELELYNQTLFRSGKWRGIEIPESELDSIIKNFEELKKYGEDSIPLILNHESENIHSKVGKITSIWREGNEIKGNLKILDNTAATKVINGIYEDFSPFLVKNYEFDTGEGKKVLPGWTLRDESFVVHPLDKKLNLTMKEESNLMDEKEKLELTEKVKTLEEELKKTKEEQERIQKENDEYKQKLEMYEKEKNQREVEDKLKMFEEQGKLLPAQHENNKQLLLTMSEEQVKMWEDGIKNLPEVVDFRTLGKKSGSESAKQIAEETLKKSGVIK